MRRQATSAEDHEAHPQPLAIARDRLGWRVWLVLALGAALVVVTTYVAEPGVFSSIDWLRIHVYYKEYLAAALRHGRLPQWNPHVMLGRPFLADVDAVAFYPASWAYLCLPPRAACAIGIWLHLLLGLYGSVKLARVMGAGPRASVATAFGFVASAPIVGAFSAGLVNYGAALCYIPLVFYLLASIQARRSLRDATLLALLLGLQLFAGHPQATWLTGFGAGLFLLGRRLERPFGRSLRALAGDLAVLASAMAAAAAMAAVVLLPLGELAAQSNREAPSLAFAGSFAMPVLGWLTLANPSDPRMPVMPNAQCYAGIVVFLLAPLVLLRWREPNVRALALVFAGAALLAAGNATPAFGVFYHLIPGLSHFRIPARASVLMTLALVLAAGTAFSQPAPRRARALLVATVLVGLAAVGANAAVMINYGGAVWRSVAYSVAWWQGGLLAVAAALLALWWRWQGQSRARARATVIGLLALLTVYDLALAGWKLRHQNRETATDPAESRLAKALATRGLLAPLTPPVRVATPFSVHENAGMRHGFSAWRGYTSFALGRVWEHLHASLGLPVPTAQVVYPEAAVVNRGPFAYDGMALSVGVEPGSQRWVVRDQADPRAYLVSAAVRVADHREATARMRDGHRFREVALLERELPAELASGGAEAFTGQAAITRFEPERIEVHVQSDRPALLVLAEPWYPGWKAVVNGRPTECFPANAWMRALPVPAGSSQVVLAYRSTYLVPGAVISLLTCAVLVFIALRRRREHH